MGKPEQTPEDGQRKPNPLIAELFERYTPLLEEAKRASKLTYEDAWVNLYQEEMKAQRTTAKRIGDDLASIGKRIGDGFDGEENEKSIGEAKKSLQDLNVQRENFERSTIAPIRKPADDCDTLIDEIVHRAARIEESTPLINKGLEDQVRKAAKSVHRPEWNEKTGQITLLVPST